MAKQWSGKNYTSEISQKISEEENLRDIIVMIDILAYERFNAIRNEGELKASDSTIYPSREHYDFAAGVLCFVFTPIKPKSFIKDMVEIRSRFIGIANNKRIQTEFSISLGNTLTSYILSIEDVVKMNPYSLFQIPLTGER